MKTTLLSTAKSQHLSPESVTAFSAPLVMPAGRRPAYGQPGNDNIRAASLIGWIDRVLLFAYDKLGLSLRRLLNLVIALVPLVVLLVGSCKTSELPSAYLGADENQSFRLALFPDRPAAADAQADYTPASGYLDRARAFVEGTPAALTRLSQQEITYLFGAPDMERRDANARVWQYRQGGCVVDFYFYTRDGQASAPVSYVDYRLGGRDPATSGGQQSDCLRKIAGSGLSRIFS